MPMKFKNLKLVLTLAIATVTVLGASAQFPSVQLKDLEGKTVDAASLNNDGKPYVVSFWATWCKPCLRELKAIHENYPDWVDETGMKLIAISVDEAQNVNRVKPRVNSEGWEYEVLLDTNGDLQRALGVQSVPHLFIIDGEGNIIESHSGYNEGSEQHIIDKVRDLVNK